MKDHILKNAINIIRNLTEDSPTMSAGTGGFTGDADPKGPVAGFDPVMKNKIRRRLSSPSSLPLSNNKKK